MEHSKMGSFQTLTAGVTSRPRGGAPRLTVLRWLPLICVLAAASVVGAAPAFTYVALLDRLVDLNGLPRLETGVKEAQFSSYDRASKDPKHWAANGDCGQYERVEANGEAVMADLKGPGCIFRLWSANPQGKIRFYLDGDTKPTYEFDFNRLFMGDFGVQQVPAPVVFKKDPKNSSSASDCYLPIPYARSCRVTADRAWGQYYHIGYKSFAPGTQVATFRLPLSAAENAKLSAVAAVWSRLGEQPQDPGRYARQRRVEVTLAPGERQTVLTLAGPATVSELRARLTSVERYALRRVMLRVSWDGESTPSVACPLGDFFGGAWEEPRYKALPLGWTEEGGYCFFRMPFRRQAVFEIENQGRKAAQVGLTVAFNTQDSIPTDFGLFHAGWRREAPGARFDYPLLEASGQGKFVGVMLFVEHPVAGWWGEGDEKIWVDGESFPSTFGTGSEDYFCGAWGIGSDLRQPCFGDNFEQEARSCCYRFHVSDSVPYGKSYRMTIENYAVGGNAYSSVAYWYARPGGTDFFHEVPVAVRLPWAREIAGAIQFEDLFPTALPSGARIVNDDDLPFELSHNQALSLGDRKPGESLGPATFKVATAGAYTLHLLGEPGKPVAGLTVAVDGKALREGAPDLARGAAVFGPKQLAAGEHHLTLGFAKPTCGLLDCLTLVRSRSENTYEAEGMELAAVNGPPPGIQEMTYSSGVLANQQNAQLFFMPTARGASVTLAFDAPAEGTYRLTWYASKSWDYGVYQASLDGATLGDPADLYAAQWEVAGAEVGATVKLTAGRHMIQFTATEKNALSKGYFLGLDAVTLEATPGG